MAKLNSAATFFARSEPHNVVRMTWLAQPCTWSADAVSSHPLGAAITTAGILLVSLLRRVFPFSTPVFLCVLGCCHQLMICCASPLPIFNSTGNFILQILIINEFIC